MGKKISKKQINKVRLHLISIKSTVAGITKKSIWEHTQATSTYDSFRVMFSNHTASDSVLVCMEKFLGIRRDEIEYNLLKHLQMDIKKLKSLFPDCKLPPSEEYTPGYDAQADEAVRAASA